MTVRVGMRSVVSSARWTVTLSSSTPTTDSPSRPVTPRFSSERSALAERLGGKVVRTRSSASTSRMRAVLGSMLRKSPRSVAPDLGDLARHLDPGGPSADHDEGQELGLALGVGLELGRLEGLEDLPADRQRALQRLQLGRVLLPFVVAEVGVLRAAGDDQRVVLQGVGRGAQSDVAQRDPALREVDVDHLGEDDPHVAPPAEDAPQRVADLRRRDRARGHLVGERLEEVEVAAIDQRHLDRHARELQRGLQAAEAAADDDDAMRRALRRRRHGADPAGCGRRRALSRGARRPAAPRRSAPAPRAPRARAGSRGRSPPAPSDRSGAWRAPAAAAARRTSAAGTA